MTVTASSSRRSQRQRCSREGCRRMTRTGKPWRYCSLTCRDIDEQLTHTQRVCEELGLSSPELWVKLVEISDLWTEVTRLQYELWLEAKSAGVTREQWDSLRTNPRDLLPGPATTHTTAWMSK